MASKKESIEDLSLAVLNMFPDKTSYAEFKNEFRNESKNATNDNEREKTIKAIIKTFFEKGVITNNSEKALISFIETNQLNLSKHRSHSQITFQDIIDKLLTIDSLNNHIKAIKKHASDFAIWEFRTSIFTRLKKDYIVNTSRKREFIRVLSYYLALVFKNRSYNYESLSRLQRSPSQGGEDVEEYGVRVDLRVKGNSEIFATRWLKDIAISQTIEELDLQHLFGLKPSDDNNTTFYLTLHKRRGPGGQSSLYNIAIRDAIHISHQILVKFLLSEYAMDSQILIAISAGHFDFLRNIQPFLLVVEKTGNSIILTEYAKYISKISDLKVIFDSNYKTFKTIEGEEQKAFRISHFWPLYFNFVSEIMKKDFFPDNEDDLLEEINFTGEEEVNDMPKAVNLLNEYPQNLFIVIEIVKILTMRKKHFCAIKIIDHALTHSPYDVVLRIYMSVNMLNIGFDSNSLFVFNRFYALAIEEIQYLTEHCSKDLDEEAFVESGLIFLSKPIFFLKYLSIGNNCEVDFKEQVAECVDSTENAINILTRGAVCSLTKPRSTFWLIYASTMNSVFKEALNKSKKSIFNNKRRSKDFDLEMHYSKSALAYFHTFGWIKRSVNELSELNDEESIFLKNKLEKAIENYSNVVLSQSFLPNIEYAFAGFIWDSDPNPSQTTVERVLMLLNDAIDKAKKCNKFNIGTMGIMWYSKVVTADEFIGEVEIVINKIKGLNKGEKGILISLQALS
ncbi:MAG: hypothetical protein GY714_31140 [Desulfobacterales bacterium]|nr:hypothetical protein [Desulfobacterales bacterium]